MGQPQIGFDSEENALLLLGDGLRLDLGRASKSELAKRMLIEIARRLPNPATGRETAQ